MQQQQNGKKKHTPSEQSLKKTLANSGYSESIADKIWKWYNPPEISSNHLKKIVTFNAELDFKLLLVV